MEALAPTLAFHMPDAFKSLCGWLGHGVPVEIIFSFAPHPAYITVTGSLEGLNARFRFDLSAKRPLDYVLPLL